VSTIKVAIAKLENELTKYVLTDSIAVSSTHFNILTSIKAKAHLLIHLQKDIDSVTNYLNLHDKTSAAWLNKIKGEPFSTLQMNMHAVKVWLCTKLCEHKFELANLKHAYHSQQMGASTFAYHNPNLMI
jgi:hypothetical protein